MKNYFKLMRVKHCVKNVLIFLPIFFDHSIFQQDLFLKALLGFCAFSCMASGIYAINDVFDVECDKNHPVKCKRPVASGAITKKGAVVFAIILIILGYAFCVWASPIHQANAYIIYSLYFLLNIIYCVGKGKDIPILDIVILASGFMFREMFGAAICGIKISHWLYLVTISGAFYLGLGKRRNEMSSSTEVKRSVLNYYTMNFLDKNMYVYMGIMIIFYSLWCADYTELTAKLIWTIPMIMILFMRYSMLVEEEHQDGDPVEIIFGDKLLLLLITIYIIVLFLIMY